MPGSPGRRYPKPSGRRWQAMRLRVFAIYGRECHLCGHGGSNQIDHLVPVSVDPALAWSLENLKPVHGVPGNRCPVCGLACNQVKQANVASFTPAARTAVPAVKPHHCDLPGCHVLHTASARCW